MDIKAIVKGVLPMESGTGRAGEWKSQTVIVEYDNGGEYPMKLALVNRRYPEEFGKIPVGAECIFKINPTSREYNGKWYTTCVCYDWQVVGTQHVPAQAQPQAQPMQPQQQPQQPQPQPQPQPQQVVTAQTPDLPF